MYTVLVTTYNRKNMLLECLARLQQLSPAPTAVVVADDGSDDGTPAAVAERFPSADVTATNRRGLGANTNTGLHAAFGSADIVLQLQDDIFLRTPLDLTPHIAALQSEEYADVAWIRLANVHSHGLNAAMRRDYWIIDWNSPGVYIASDQVHIKHRRFHDVYGYYPEGLRIGDTENTWCGDVKARGQQLGAPRVAVPVYLNGQQWTHEGASWQSQGL
jgi:glycosyltransferase involved in cell wall biosynthesis